jgi:general secretion pathway protein G
MRTSAIYPRANGFTLLELLIVLLVLGLVSGLILPRLSNIYDGMVTIYEKEDILVQLNSLHFKVFQYGQVFDLISYPLPKDAPKLLELPPNWILKTETPIRFRSNGSCSGGHLTLLHGEEIFKVKLEPPFCRAISL